MDLDLFSGIIRKLILVHDRVSLPGMGSFIAETVPSVFSDRAMVIHPPFRRILFRPSEIWNDGILEDAYASEFVLDKDKARSEIAEFVSYMKRELNAYKSLRIPEFGTMRATEQNDYFFVAEKGLFNYLETFGLEPLNIKILPKKGEVEIHSKSPVKNFFGEISKPVRHFVSDVESGVKKLQQQPNDGEEKTQDVVEKEKEEEEKTQDVIEEGYRNVVESEVVNSVESVQKEHRGAVKAKESRFIKRVIIVLSVVFFILALFVLAVVFKDELRPFWEWLLYTEEEREFLRSM